MIGDEGLHFADVANWVAMAALGGVGWLLKLIHAMSTRQSTLTTEVETLKNGLAAEKATREKQVDKLFDQKADK